MDEELQALKVSLQKISEENAPSDQEQRWAWTRLDARLITPTRQSGSFTWIRAAGWGVLASLALCVSVAFYNFNNPLGFAPTITSSDPDLSAVYFYSKDASADVIWVSGYDYLPQDYAIR